ncbi:MAG TPA: TraR/DksA C4-type zinc finger protein [Acidimicrobiales bacterium]|nr:TraR/DksA C4-type zinc finger protein [Acidimicrobiales bacterium]
MPGAKSAATKKTAPLAGKAVAAKRAAPEKGAPPKKAAAEKAPAKAVGKVTAQKAGAEKAPVKAAAKETPAKAAAKKAPANKAVAEKAPVKAVTKSVPRPPYKPTPGGYANDDRFLAHQREALLAERVTYLEQAASLKAEAESLVEEMEPGDVQFDEESGEGATSTVDRERDLALSAQALLAVEEIDFAFAKIANGRYGVCEGCGELIGKPRLEALPYARLCIACKSGGLSRR